MSGNTGPLGKYADIVAAIISIAIFAVWLTVHIFPNILSDTVALDTMAALAAGVIFGRSAAFNGVVKTDIVNTADKISTLESKVTKLENNTPT